MVRTWKASQNGELARRNAPNLIRPVSVRRPRDSRANQVRELPGHVLRVVFALFLAVMSVRLLRDGLKRL